ncbi:MAG: protease SohB [Pseudomonadales bacterium]
MSYLYEYLLFLAQAVTLTVVVLIVLSALASFGNRRSAPSSGHLAVTKLNDQLEDYRNDLRGLLLEKDAYKQLTKAEERESKAKAKADKEAEKKKAEAQPQATATDEAEADTQQPSPTLPVAKPLPGRPRLFVVDFEGDIQASKVDHLSHAITAVLTVASIEDEILVRVESPGGLVHAYGLAASQLARIRSREIPLTVAVDKVAASGGYMMAAVANRIISAPFAVLGSIGVVAQVPNVHRLLKKNDVDVEVLTAGKYKRTLTILGENTEEGREKFVEELEVTHELFQEHVSRFRPAVDIEAVATGEAWYGERAIGMKLVDEIMTSDDYMIKSCESRDVLQVSWKEDKKPLDRLFERIQAGIRSLSNRWASQAMPTPSMSVDSRHSTWLGRMHSSNWTTKVDFNDE